MNQLALFDAPRLTAAERRLSEALDEGAVLLDRTYDGWQMVAPAGRRIGERLESLATLSTSGDET